MNNLILNDYEDDRVSILGLTKDMCEGESKLISSIKINYEWEFFP